MKEKKQRVIGSNSSLFSQYHDLESGDIITGRVRLKPTEESLLLDLVERGVHFIPSALSQLISRSKSMQSYIFPAFMIPLTKAIHDQHRLLETVSLYNRNSIKNVVTKHDRKNAGMGIHIWGVNRRNLHAGFIQQHSLSVCCPAVSGWLPGHQGYSSWRLC